MSRYNLFGIFPTEADARAADADSRAALAEARAATAERDLLAKQGSLAAPDYGAEEALHPHRPAGS
jgi:hypothetical protein